MSRKLEFDQRLFLSLKEGYAKAVKENREQFSLEGQILLTSYAKYLIEYLSPQFEKAKK